MVEDRMPIGDAAITALFGYVVVFVGLLILMLILVGVAQIFKSIDKKKAAEAAAKAEAEKASASNTVAPKKEENLPLAPGSAGHVKLYDVPDKEAAMVMAVVAYKLQKPLNELRFISIKEVK